MLLLHLTRVVDNISFTFKFTLGKLYTHFLLKLVWQLFYTSWYKIWKRFSIQIIDCLKDSLIKPFFQHSKIKWSCLENVKSLPIWNDYKRKVNQIICFISYFCIRLFMLEFWKFFDDLISASLYNRSFWKQLNVFRTKIWWFRILTFFF